MTTPVITASRMIPDKWSALEEVISSSRHEGHRLLLHLLDQVNCEAVSWFELGVRTRSVDEEVEFICKLESVALFALLAERYGTPFGLDKQTVAFTTNRDLFELAADLGIQVMRSDLPWAMDVVGLDKSGHDNFDLPPDQLPLDILFTVAGRCRDWYEDTIGSALAYNGRHRMVHAEEVGTFVRETLASAYGTYLEEIENGAEKELAYEVVRRSLGQ